MNCNISLSIFGESFEFRIKKLSRKNLYGSKKIVAKNGDEECEKAYVNENGMIILTNGCTKLFSPVGSEVESVKEKSKNVVGKRNVESLFDKRLNGLGFSLNKNDAFSAERFLDAVIVASYQLTTGDKDQMRMAKELLGSEIWRVGFRYEDGCDDSFYIFSNESGIFICLCDFIANKFLFEENLISADNELEILDEDYDIDFENLW